MRSEFYCPECVWAVLMCTRFPHEAKAAANMADFRGDSAHDGLENGRWKAGESAFCSLSIE